MPTLVTEPSNAIPNRSVVVKFALTNPDANFLRVWVTDAPVGSKLKVELDKGVKRFEVFTSEKGLNWSTGDFDKGGVYVLLCQEYRLGASDYGGGFENDPNAAPSETKIGSETTLALEIGQRMTQIVGFGRDNAQLVLWVWGGMIRPTTLSVHGENTPDVVNPSTPRAVSAVADVSVRNAVAALKDLAVTDALGDLGAVLDDLRTKFLAHRSQSGVHANNDAHNGIERAFARMPTPSTLPNIIAELSRKLRQHISNDAGGATNVAGMNSADYHNVTGKVVDWDNMPLFAAVSGVADGYAAIADLWRSYEGHRQSNDDDDGVHANADTTNALDASLVTNKILNVHRHFLAALAASAPTIPPTKNSGAVLLASQAGFVES